MRACIVFQSHGLSDAEIAPRLGYKNSVSVSLLRSSKWFHAEAKRMQPRLPRPVGKKVGRLTAKDHARIRELHGQGLNNDQIAKAMPQWGHATIQRHLKKLGLRPHKKAPLSDAEKAEILRLRQEAGLSHAKIGKRIGRPESTVGAFCLKHFGYTYRPRTQETPSQNGTPKHSFHARSSLFFLPSPRRTPMEITRAVRESLQRHPKYCDGWHARRCDVLETLVARIRLQLRIPTMRERHRKGHSEES